MQSPAITKPSVWAECWCLPCVKSMGNSSRLSFLSLSLSVVVSHSSVIAFLYFGMARFALFFGGRVVGRIRMGNSGNKVGRGLELELWVLEPRRGSRLVCDASWKVGQWATGSVNAFSLSRCLSVRSSACPQDDLSVFIHFLYFSYLKQSKKKPNKQKKSKS